MIGHTGAGGGFAASVMFEPGAERGDGPLVQTQVIQEDVARHVLHESVPLEVTPSSSPWTPRCSTASGDIATNAGGVAGIRRTETR